MSAMTEVIREVQLPLLAVLLLLGALAKSADRSRRGQGPAVLLPPRWRRPATLANGAAEGVLAVAVMVLPGLPGGLARGAVAALFAGAAVALVVLRRTAPDMGCGCFGSLSTTPVDWRSITRGALLAVAAGVTVGLPATGAGVVAAPTLGHGAVLVVEVALLAALSPELVELRKRALSGTPCEVREVPVSTALARLRASDVWRTNAGLVVADDPEDVWRQGCWSLAAFAGRRDGRDVDVVFAIPVEGRRPAVRAAVTDRETGEVLARFGAVGDGEREERAESPAERPDTGTGGRTARAVATAPAGQD
ncbi:methylamine utilization protein MauD [Streptomonospora sp. NEAU-YY374]|nr:methylamine utilization protein MauD [Streptomonospora nanhaiensis]